MTPNIANPDEIARLRAGLDEAARRGPKLSAHGKRSEANRTARRRAQLRLTELEHAALGLARNVLGLHLGRPISRAVATRLALYRFFNDTHRSLKDPALAARLRAEMLDVREERTKAVAP